MYPVQRITILFLFAARFTEDGSFIGQYGHGGRKPNEQQSPSAIATFV